MSNELTYDPDNDYYAILNIHPKDGWNLAELKRKYKRLVLKFHPDKHPISAQKYFHIPFTRIQNAYDVLQDYSCKAMTYSNERDAYYRRLYKYIPQRESKSFLSWMNDHQHTLNLNNELKRANFLNHKSEILRKEERERQEKQEAREQEKRKEHDKYQKERQAEKRRREEKQRKQEEAKRRKKEKEQEEEKASVKYIEKFKKEMKEVEQDFKIWEVRQKVKREEEVKERESVLRCLKQGKEDAIQRLDDTLNQKIEELRNLCAGNKQKIEQQHEREIRRKMARQEKERQIQRTERKCVRDSYQSWYKEMESIVEGNRPPQANTLKRPSFYRPSFGRRKDGMHCANCIKAGGFCDVHKNQQW